MNENVYIMVYIIFKIILSKFQTIYQNTIQRKYIYQCNFFELLDFSSGYQVIVDKDFGSIADCMPEYVNQWLTYTYKTINDCAVCTNVGTGTPTAGLYLLPSSNGAYIRIFAPKINYPYQIVGYEVVYAQVNDVSVKLTINLQATKTISSPQYTLYEQVGDINCGGSNLKYQKATLIMNTQLTPYSSYIGFGFESITNPIFIKQIRFWTNCCLNCQTCASSNQCLICMQGFQKYQFSGGQTVCEQTSNCNSANCFSCAKFGATEDCITCSPGFYLDGNGDCQDYNAGSPCHTSSTYLNSSLQCKNYNTVCYNEDPNTLVLTDCGNKENYQTYKCPENKQVIIYKGQNYGVYQCTCNIDNCLSCSTANTCSTCEPGYTYNSTTKKCNSNCATNQYYDVSTSTCKNCGVNCSTCNSQHCLTCNTSAQYIQASTPKDCASCTVTNCQTCSADGKCLICNTGYFTSSDRSLCNVACLVSNCITCVVGSGTQCQTCQVNFVKNGSNQCVCNVNHCDICDMQNGNNCQICTTGYLLNGTKKCDCAVSNCGTCNTSNGALCDACINSYTLSGDFTQCLCTVPNCNQCVTTNGTQCQTCQSGYLLNGTTKQCDCQVLNCQTGDPLDGTKCNTCVNNYLLSGDKATCSCQVTNCTSCQINDGLKCQTCAPGYTVNPTTFLCECPVQNCQTCNTSNPSLCDTCVNLYSLSLDFMSCTCQASNCNTCQPNDGSKCQSCKNGYNLNIVTYQCDCSVQNCQTCNSANGTQCDTCQNQYLQSMDHTQCTCQVANCNQCQINNGQQCQTCKAGYLLNGANQCDCQVANCSQCQINDGLQCQTCQSGYLLNISNQCDCQVANCNLCQANNGLQCQTCQNGYLLNGSNQCDCQVVNCNQCQVNNGLQCQICQTGYLLNGSNQCDCQAQNCLTCKLTDGNLCQSCKTGYILNPITFQCECGAQNCASCSNLDGNVCLTCQNDFLLNNVTNQCEINCTIQHCQTCSSNQVCSNCEIGYELSQDQTQCIEFNKNGNINKYKVSISVIDSGYKIKIDFNEKLINCKINDKIEQVKLSIMGFTQYTYQVTKSDENQLIAIVNCNENIKQAKVQIDFQIDQFVMENRIGDLKDVEDLPAFVIISADVKETVAQVTTVAQGVSTTVISGFVPLAIIGNFYFLVNMIDLTAFLYYLTFLDIRYPLNVTEFYALFKDFQFPFIPNFFSDLIENGYTQPGPKKFVDMGVDSYLISNSGQSMTICFCVTGLYLFVKLCHRVIPNRWLHQYLSRIIYETWEYGAFFDMMSAVYIYILIGCLLQSLVFNFDDKNTFVLNYFLYVFWITVCIWTPLHLTYFLFKQKNLKNSKRIQVKLSSYISGLVIENEDFDWAQPMDNALQREFTLQKEKKKNFFNQNQQKSQSINMNDELKESKNNPIIAQNEVTLKKNPFSSEVIHELDEEQQGVSPMLQKGPQLFSNKRPRTKLLNLQQLEKENNNSSPNDKNNIKNDDYNLDLNEKFHFGQHEIYNPDEQSEQNNSIQDIDPRTRRQKHTAKYSKMCSSFLYIRKILFGLIIVFLYGYCYLQLALLLCLSAFMMFFIIYIQPYDKTSENIKNCAAEVVLVVIEICAYYLVEDDINEAEESRLRIGWVIVLSSGFVILWNTVILAKDTLISLYQSLKKLYQKNFNNPLRRQNTMILTKKNPSKIYNYNFENQDNNFEHQDSIQYEKNKNKDIALEDAQTYGKKSSSSLFSSNGLLMRRKRVPSSSGKTSASNSDVFSLNNQQSLNSFRPSALSICYSPRTDNLKQIENNENFKISNLDQINQLKQNEESMNLDIQDVQLPFSPFNSHASPQKILFSIQNEFKLSTTEQSQNSQTPTRRRRGSQNTKPQEKKIYNKSTFTEYNNIRNDLSNQK